MIVILDMSPKECYIASINASYKKGFRLLFIIYAVQTSRALRLTWMTCNQTKCLASVYKSPSFFSPSSFVSKSFTLSCVNASSSTQPEKQ